MFHGVYENPVLRNFLGIVFGFCSVMMVYTHHMVARVKVSAFQRVASHP